MAEFCIFFYTFSEIIDCIATQNVAFDEWNEINEIKPYFRKLGQRWWFLFIYAFCLPEFLYSYLRSICGKKTCKKLVWTDSSRSCLLPT